MSELERIKVYVKETPIPGGKTEYGLSLSEAIALAHLEPDLYIKLLRAFEYGRAKGIRAAQKEAAREQMKEVIP